MFITEEDLVEILGCPINEAIDKFNSRENGLNIQTIQDGITLYHRPKDSTVNIAGKELSIIDSLFTYGFSREFTSSNGGNMYGAGVYTVYNLKSSVEDATGYGRAIIKVKLIGGYKDFFILSAQLAKETYGNNWKPCDQIRYLFPENADDILSNFPKIAMHDESNPSMPLVFDSDGNQIPNNGEFRRSADSMYSITLHLLNRLKNSGKCRGWVYNGGHDGDCCVILDFQSAIPVEVSFDNGATWENHLTQNLVDNISGDVDTQFQYGDNYKKVADKAINGFTMVWNDNGEVNYIPVGENEPISEIWFDSGFNFEKLPNGNLKAEVRYDGEDYFLFKVGDRYVLSYTDGEQIGFLDEL